MKKLFLWIIFIPILLIISGCWNNNKYNPNLWVLKYELTDRWNEEYISFINDNPVESQKRFINIITDKIPEDNILLNTTLYIINHEMFNERYENTLFLYLDGMNENSTAYAWATFKNKRLVDRWVNKDMLYINEKWYNIYKNTYSWQND